MRVVGILDLDSRLMVTGRWELFVQEGELWQTARESEPTQIVQLVRRQLQLLQRRRKVTGKERLVGREGQRVQSVLCGGVQLRILSGCLVEFPQVPEEVQSTRSGLPSLSLFISRNRTSHTPCEFRTESAHLCPVSQCRECSDDQRRESAEEGAQLKPLRSPAEAGSEVDGSDCESEQSREIAVLVECLSSRRVHRVQRVDGENRVEHPVRLTE